MIDLLSRLAPLEMAGPLVLAGAAWVGVNYGMAPEFSERLAERQFLPACRVNLETMVQEAETRHEARALNIAEERERLIERARSRAAKLSRDVAKTKLSLDLATGALGPLLEAVDPEGRYRDTVEELLPKVPEIDIGTLDLPEVPQSFVAPDNAEIRDHCACLVDGVLYDRKTDLTLHTSSLTLYDPGLLVSVEADIVSRARSGACGDLF